MNGDYWQKLFLAFLWFSARWGLVIGMVWLGFKLTKPRRIEIRLTICQLALAGGLLIAVLPVFWGPERKPPQSQSDSTAMANSQLPEMPAWLLEANAQVPRRLQAKPADLRSGPVNASVDNESSAEKASSTAPLAVTLEQAQSPLPSRVSETIADRAYEPLPLNLASISLRILMIVWGLGVLFSLIRLAAGWCWLRRLRRTARLASASATCLLEQCRNELGITQPIQLLVHHGITVPVLIGQLRPAIALPVAWDELPAVSRRAALLHELTHFANHDQWAKLRDELVRAVFFFHPLVRWLLNILESCREERCDAAVVKQGIGPRELARVLFDFASGNSGALRASLLANSFFNQVTVKDRINHLLENDFMSSTTRLSRRGRVALVIGLVGLATGIGGFGLRNPSVQAQSETTPAPVDASNVAGNKLDSAPAAPVSTGRVVDEQDRPVAGAHVLLYRHLGSAKPVLTLTDAQGNFTFAALPGDRFNGCALMLVAARAGFAPATQYVTERPGLTLKLTKAATVSGSVRDHEARPIAGARVVLVGIVEEYGTMSTWGYVDEWAIRGTPIEPFFVGKSDAKGEFKITSVPADAKLFLRASAPGYADLDTAKNGPPKPYLTNPNSPPAALKLGPEGRISGRVITKIAGLSLAGLTVFAGPSSGLVNGYKRTTTDSGGQFEFAGLQPNTFDLWIDFFDPKIGAVRTQMGLSVEAGKTARAELQIVPGTLVEGSVLVAATGMPVTDAWISLQSPALPRQAFGLHEVHCDANGRYAVRLPAGDYAFILRNPGKGFTQPPAYRPSNIKITEGLAAAEGPTVRVVPVTPKVALKGRIIDAAGKPIEGAKIIGLCKGASCMAFGGQPVVSDEFGHFELAQGPQGSFTMGEATTLQVELAGNKTFESHIMTVAGLAEVQLPTFVSTLVPAQQDVKPNDLEGLVVDENQRPLEGVRVHAWHWVDKPENQAVTGKDGRFKIVDCASHDRAEVRFLKPGYSPVLLTQQKTGVQNLVVALDAKTYFEGLVLRPDGKPAAHAKIRANQGPKQLPGGMADTIWTDTTADDNGRYRLYVCPDEYEFLVKASGVGAVRLVKTSIFHGEARKVDFKLEPAIQLRAVTVDSQSGRPVAGVRLHNWEQKEFEGRSNAEGRLIIEDMIPGSMRLEVEAEGYTRWWSPEAIREWERFEPAARPGSKWQRNFDSLEFDARANMDPVKITLEKGVRVTGRVLDPDGKPVGGATVAPALTGSGNSLTGDTRFSVESKADGSFEMLLPASGKAEYNLVVHDGKYEQWRKWANGVLPPIQTTPGQEIKDVTIQLTRPATVRGRVVDADNKPVAGREVRASAADKRENRYYDPTTKTKADGTFELRFVRAGKQHIQVAPFWLSADEAPEGTSKTVQLKEGQELDAVELIAGEKK